MAFESVRGYVELASGLTDLTRARAKEAAQGLLSLPAAGITSGGKMAVQASALADELLAAAAANRQNLTKLVRTEVDLAISRIGLVSVQQLEEAQAEAARLRAEVTRLRSASAKTSAPKTTAAKTTADTPAAAKPAAKKAAAKKAAAKKPAAQKTSVKKAAPSSAAKKAAAQTAKTATKAGTAGRSAVTTRAKPAGR